MFGTVRFVLICHLVMEILANEDVDASREKLYIS